MTWQPSAPARRYDYVTDGPAIYVDSFATIRREADLSSVPASAERLAVRMVHGSGQVDLVQDLVIHPEVVPAAREALEAGAPVLCDARMVAVGVTASRLPRDNEVRCDLTDSRVPGLAARWGTTSTAAAVSLWEPVLEGAVVAIGNAPTALFHLLEMLVDGGPRPAAIVGCPVGFIGAAESKQALADLRHDHGIDVPFVTVRGRRGGSAMCSSAVNALAQEAEGAARGCVGAGRAGRAGSGGSASAPVTPSWSPSRPHGSSAPPTWWPTTQVSASSRTRDGSRPT